MDIKDIGNTLLKGGKVKRHKFRKLPEGVKKAWVQAPRSGRGLHRRETVTGATS